jgi:hypothetical protein
MLAGAPMAVNGRSNRPLHAKVYCNGQHNWCASEQVSDHGTMSVALLRSSCASSVCMYAGPGTPAAVLSAGGVDPHAASYNAELKLRIGIIQFATCVVGSGSSWCAVLLACPHLRCYLRLCMAQHEQHAQGHGAGLGQQFTSVAVWWLCLCQAYLPQQVCVMNAGCRWVALGSGCVSHLRADGPGC